MHRPYQKGETIAAIATPPGEGGVAIVRISGDQALTVAEKIYSGKIRSYQSHTIHFGKIMKEGQVVDEVLLVVMKNPRSYTGEDTVEIHCHGGSLISKRVLQTILDAGARAALPGEFTFKAYMNGKLDLAQAEAVQELIAAKNDLALHAAEHQLSGALSKKIECFQKELVDIAAILEAWVDFPEEGLEFTSFEEVILSLESTRKKMELLNQTFDEGKIVHEGLTMCLSGAPNVGKSSLMNALLGKERAIVTAIPGTTRDLLEADLRIGGLHFRLVDTAGIRATDEIVEQEGIRRSHQALIDADLILLVLDASRGVQAIDQELLKIAPPHKTLVVWNKVDLPAAHPKPEHALEVSAKEGKGLENLRQAIDQKIWRVGPPSKEEIVITNERHHQALNQAIASIELVINGLKNKISAEFVAADMRRALLELGTIIGTDITEDILSAIFSKFCVGK
ncbi:MAG TPA: tRNA uridine-5-carboxymethylaminomethyl(34) synthesis GTPase MnmE [Rhabdochlamydiaceae bacterium]|jgi:tRNA modification GTPase|nr:tRNA uridine-5-carboxymethylaminomethyl(34) synthesis GTPase MnmE [Rhabdochlamydiaceae bacterium]